MHSRLYGGSTCGKSGSHQAQKSNASVHTRPRRALSTRKQAGHRPCQTAIDTFKIRSHVEPSPHTYNSHVYHTQTILIIILALPFACLFAHAHVVTIAVTTWLANRSAAGLAAKTATVEASDVASRARDTAHGVSVVHLERIVVRDQQLATEEVLGTLEVFLLRMRLFTALG